MTGDEMKDEGVTLSLDKPRAFKVTWNTMRKLQKQYGSVEKAMEKVAESDFDAILYLLWAAQTGVDVLTEDRLGELITPELFGSAFSSAFGLAREKPKKRGLFHRKNG